MSTTDAGALARASSELHGGTRVRKQVIDKVVRETSRVEVGVPRGDVSVEVAEWGGALAVRVTTSLPVPSLDDTAAIRAAVPLPDRLRQLQTTLAEELSRLTGREVRRISFVVTGAVVAERKRMK